MRVRDTLTNVMRFAIAEDARCCTIIPADLTETTMVPAAAHISCRYLVVLAFLFKDIRGLSVGRRGPRAVLHHETETERAGAQLHGHGLRQSREQGISEGEVCRVFLQHADVGQSSMATRDQMHRWVR